MKLSGIVDLLAISLTFLIVSNLYTAFPVIIIYGSPNEQNQMCELYAHFPKSGHIPVY